MVEYSIITMITIINIITTIIIIIIYVSIIGKAHDAVGPCEYDPKTDVKFKSVRKADFTHVSYNSMLLLYDDDYDYDRITINDDGNS